MVTGAPEQSALYTWVATNGQIIYFFAQLLFWIVAGAAAAWAAFMYTRYVNFMIGGAKPAAPAVADEADEAVTVDQFVE